RQHVGRLRRAHPPDALAHARRRAPTRRAPTRLARHVVHGTLRRRARGHHVISGKATAPIRRAAEQGHAAVLSVVDGRRAMTTPLTVHLPFNRDILGRAFTPAKRGAKPPVERGHWILVQDQNLLVIPEAGGFRLPHGDCPLSLEKAPFWLGMYRDT